MTTEKKENKISIKDKIFSVKQLPERTVKVPEWDGVKITIRAMNGTQRDHWDRFTAQRTLKAKANNETVIDNLGMNAKILIMTAYDSDGELMFSEDDISRLQECNGQVLDRLAQISLALSGIGVAQEASAAKNS